MTAPLVTVAVTTYRRPEWLIECIDSVLAQTLTDFELLIGNNDDRTPLDLAGRGDVDPRIRIIDRPKNIGQLPNMNDLLARARGKFFTWLADDDAYAPGFLEALAGTLERRGRFAHAFCGYTSDRSTLDRRPASALSVEAMPGQEFVSRYVNQELAAIGNYGVWRTDTLRALGGIEQMGTGMSPYSDNMLVIRAATAPVLLYTTAPLLFYRLHEGATSCAATDLDSYVTAQQDLLTRSREVFACDHLSRDAGRNLYRLVTKWCLPHYAEIVSRKGKLSRDGFRAYRALLLRAAAPLGLLNRLRIRWHLWRRLRAMRRQPWIQAVD